MQWETKLGVGKVKQLNFTQANSVERIKSGFSSITASYRENRWVWVVTSFKEHKLPQYKDNIS